MIYTRVAYAGTDAGAVGHAEQETACRRYCLHHGLAVAEVISDVGSGLRTDLPGLRRLRERIDAGAIAGVVVWRMDRLTRSVSRLLHVLDPDALHGVSIVAVVGQLDPATPGAWADLDGRAPWRRSSMAARLAAGIPSRHPSGVLP
jgi:DNA invertase Pin-like site-specific DNA recombinase